LARRWFRFGKKQEEQAAPEQAAVEEATPPEALIEPGVTEPAADDTPPVEPGA